MAVLQAILTGISRSTGRILNTAFGWATTMLFGKVPKDKQIYLSLIAFGSILWVICAIGVAFPRVGAFLLSFVRLPEWVNDNWVRTAMLAAAILIPAVTGVISTRLADEDRRSGQNSLHVIARGYMFTIGLAVTLVLLVLLAPLMKLRTLARGWITEHVPLVAESADYEEVVGELQQALKTAGWQTQRESAPWMLTVPTKVMTTISGTSADKLIGEQLVMLASKDLEVILHPADMALSGKEADVMRVRAALADQLAFSKAYLTWDKDANALEDKIRGVWNQIQSSIGGEVPPESVRELKDIQKALRTVKLPFEEWQILGRATLLVERGMLQMMAGIVQIPAEPLDTPPNEIGARQIADARSRQNGGWLADAGTMAVLATLAWLGIRRPGNPNMSGRLKR